MGDFQSTVVVATVIILVLTAMLAGSAYISKIEKEKGKFGS